MNSVHKLCHCHSPGTVFLISLRPLLANGLKKFVAATRMSQIKMIVWHKVFSLLVMAAKEQSADDSASSDEDDEKKIRKRKEMTEQKEKKK